MSQLRVVRNGVLIVTAGFLLQQAIAFVTSVVVARTIGAGEFGVFSVLRNISVFLLTLTPLGLDLALLKHAAFYDHRPHAFQRQIVRLRLVVAAVNVAMLLLVVLGAGRWLQLHVYRFHDFDRLLLVTLLGVPFASDLAVLGAVYRADNRPASFALMTNYVQPFIRLFGAITLLWLGLSTMGVIIANTTAYVVSSLLVVTHRRSMRPASESGLEAHDEGWNGAVTVLTDSLWMAVSLFVGGAMRSVDVLTLGIFVVSKEVGTYGAMSTIAQLVQAYPFAASQTLGPTVSRHYRDGDVNAMRNAMSRYLWSASIVGGFLFGGIAAMGDHLDLLFGHSFHFRPDIAFMLPLGWLISATLGPMGYCLSMTGRHRFELGILLFGFVLLVVGCAVLVPRWGQIGAATAVVVAFSLINFVRFAYASWQFGIVPGDWKDLLPPVVAYLLAFAVINASDRLLGRSIWAFLLSCVVYAALNAIVAFNLYLADAERATVRRRLALAIPFQR